MNDGCILIVDDNGMSRKLLRAILEAEHFRVCEAVDGIEALEQLQRESIAAVVSDILMPRMDGYRLCHEVRKHEKWSMLPFLMYSATYANAGDRKLAIEMGADGFVRKPASGKEIVEVLLSIMKPSSHTERASRAPPAEFAVMKQYSERMVTKLDERSTELAKRSSELQISELRYRTLVEAANDTIFSMDCNGIMQYMNGRGAQDFNLPAHELVGKSQSELFPPHIASKNMMLIEQVTASGQPLHEESTRPVRGEDRWHSTWLVALKDDASRVSGVMGIARDVTDRKRREELRARLSFSLSHELNTPLVEILGVSEILRQGIDTIAKSELENMVELLRQSASRLDRLVQQNLDYAQLELVACESRQDATPPEATMAGSSVIRDSAQQMANHHQRSADLVLEIADIGKIAIAKRYLARLIIELLDNAFKFSKEGTPVLVQAVANGSCIEIVVADQGCGMSAEEMTAIAAFKQFEPKHRQQQGSGLGLYLARKVAERCGGELQIDSKRDAGTTVTVTMLPGSAVQH